MPCQAAAARCARTHSSAVSRSQTGWTMLLLTVSTLLLTFSSGMNLCSSLRGFTGNLRSFSAGMDFVFLQRLVSRRSNPAFLKCNQWALIPGFWNYSCICWHVDLYLSSNIVAKYCGGSALLRATDVSPVSLSTFAQWRIFIGFLLEFDDEVLFSC